MRSDRAAPSFGFADDEAADTHDAPFFYRALACRAAVVLLATREWHEQADVAATNLILLRCTLALLRSDED
ncbi:MAG TPA: hypothetical protein VMD98_08425 [Bryocella sp.]|nr:hypothetical protein [Bryocella sp.]